MGTTLNPKLSPPPPLLLLLLQLISLLSQLVTGQQNRNFTRGSTIADTSSPANSTNLLFSLGFVAANSSSSFSLGIWYSSDSQKFLVWRPVQSVVAPAGSRLSFTSDGILALFSSPSASSPLWSTSPTSGTTAQLTDSGELVLLAANSSKVWSSFANPADTLLPDQLLTATGSRLVAASTTSGSNYSLGIDAGSGNVTLFWASNVTYWSAGSSAGTSSAVAKLGGSGLFTLFTNASTAATSGDIGVLDRFFSNDFSSSTSVSRRVTLDSDGNLRIYSLVSSSWQSQWQALENPCLVYGACGPFGICSVAADANTACSCPPGLLQVDPRAAARGCRLPGGNLSGCPPKMLRLPATRWLEDPAARASVVGNNEEGCQSGCLSDAGCVGCLSRNDGSGRCITFTSSFLSAYTLPFLQGAAFLKVCSSTDTTPPPPPRSPSCTNSSSSRGALVGGTAVAVAVGEGIIFFLWMWRRKRKQRQRRGSSSGGAVLLDYTSGAPTRFTFKELQEATDDFRERIGDGGFGAVYRGQMAAAAGGAVVEVAVKRLEGVMQGDREFRAEVATIGSTHHVNLMRLVGFCCEGTSTRLLVYDYMPNGSLDRLLFRHPHDRSQGFHGFTSSSASSRPVSSSATSSNQSGLIIASGFSLGDEDDDQGAIPWKTRFAIAMGTAKAMAYLHEECRECIIHCDLKPENILLDNYMNPKVSDFGLAKMVAPQLSAGPLSSSEQQHQRSSFLTAVRGTRGYLAPEWLTSTSPISPKSDVFSYGMVLLELAAGRRNFDDCPLVLAGRARFPSWAFRQLESGAGGAAAVCDPAMEIDEQQAERLLRVAFWCIQESPQERPSMTRVVQMLDGTVQVPFPPTPRSL